MTTPTQLAEAATLLPDRVEQHYGPSSRVQALRDACTPFTISARPVDPDTLRELEAAAKTVFRHIDLTHAENLEPEDRSRGWAPEDLEASKRAGAGIAGVHLHEDGTAVIELTGLAPVAAAAPVLAGAFTLVRHAAQVVLDLRANGGGDPATVALIADWLIGGQPRHLFNVHYRDRTRQWWTAGAPVAEPPSGRARALIGPGTYSSGEALAWVLQQQRLATLVGEPTRGAADHVVPLALTHDVHALIPEASVRAPDGSPTWEGNGVQPDEPLAESSASNDTRSAGADTLAPGIHGPGAGEPTQGPPYQ